MAETMVTDPVYLDQTAKDNGKKLDQMTAALLGMSSSLGASRPWWLPVTHRRFSPPAPRW